jgi:multimeric flavodoxin WrbA
MNSKKMLAILGSPREKGNIAKMLDIAVKQATANGYEVTFVNLYKKDIAYCTGCMGCKKTSVCVIKDDMQDIRKAFIQSDLIVMACPTYFANVTAPVKNMLDRLVGAVMDDNDSVIPKPKLSKKQKYILMTTCSTPFPFDRLAGQSTGCLKAMKEVMHISGMSCAGKVVFAGTRNKNQIKKLI